MRKDHDDLNDVMNSIDYYLDEEEWEEDLTERKAASAGKNKKTVHRTDVSKSKQPLQKNKSKHNKKPLKKTSAKEKEKSVRAEVTKRKSGAAVKASGKSKSSVAKAGSRTKKNRRYQEKGSGLWYKIKHMDIVGRLLAAAGIFILIFAAVTCTVYVKTRAADQQVSAFKAIREQMTGIRIVGESDLLAVANARTAIAEAIKEAENEKEPKIETEFEEKELETKGTIHVVMNLSSMQRDLKIKFTNQKTGKLIANIPFTVVLTDSAGKKTTWKDDDEDGIIYHTEVTPGKCSVSIEPLTDSKDYLVSDESVTVTVKDKIEYKKVDVSAEVKKESEVNAAKEDTKKDEVVESVLADTVLWVESTKTPKNPSSGDGYEAVPKEKITDPATKVKAESVMRYLKTSAQAPSADAQALSAASAQAPSADAQALSAADAQAPPATEQVPPVTPVPTEIKVSLNQTSLSLKIGETALLTAVTDPQGNAVTWESSQIQTAAVAEGTVTAAAVGTADIIVKTGTGNTAVCTVTVTEPEKLRPLLTISASEGNLLTGNTLQLAASVSNAEDKNVLWSSDNSAVASVSADGTITGVSKGTAVITAACSADQTITASCRITVQSNVSGDNTSKLKDNDGNQLYVKNSDGSYREAVYADYYTNDQFFKQTKNTEYLYTGWQTIDGKTYYFTAEGNKVTGEQVIRGAKYNFGGEGALTASSGNLGIDVSKWNGKIDWNAVKSSGVSYVIIRCGYRGSTTGALIEDPQYRANIKGASAAGLKVGIYFFSQAVNEVEAVEEASMVLSLIGGYGISYPVFIDVESSGGRGDGISKEVRTEACRAFCQTIQNSGYSAGIYSNKIWFTQNINTGSLANYKIWLAQYAAAPTYTATRYDLWQYTSKGTVAGISGGVDMNISYMGH